MCPNEQQLDRSTQWGARDVWVGVGGLFFLCRIASPRKDYPVPVLPVCGGNKNGAPGRPLTVIYNLLAALTGSWSGNRRWQSAPISDSAGTGSDNLEAALTGIS